jgi:hypothetical protein
MLWDHHTGCEHNKEVVAFEDVKRGLSSNQTHTPSQALSISPKI